MNDKTRRLANLLVEIQEQYDKRDVYLIGLLETGIRAMQSSSQSEREQWCAHARYVLSTLKDK